VKKNNPVRILLVEDNPDHAEIAVRVLEGTAPVEKIDVVTDGEQALDYLYGKGDFSGSNKPKSPAIILLDIKLPKIDGIEVLRNIKNDDVLKKIPVVILTTSESDKDVASAYAEGANSYIAKPVSYQKLVDKLIDLGFYWTETNILPGEDE